nr:hypothetical protein [Paenibacillus bovis]
MKLIFKDEVIQFDTQPTVEVMLNKINQLLDNHYYFSHLIVDDKEVFDDPERYLQDYLSGIREIEIVAKTVKQFINDLLLSAKEYIRRAKPEIDSLSDEFYQNPTHESWHKFTQLLEGIQWINQVIQTIDTTKEKPKNWMNYIDLISTLDSELKNMEEAIENSDSVLIADLIKYEILSIIESLGSEIQSTIDTEGYHHDLN